MRATRSFARSRFWPYGAPEFTVPLVELLVFNLMFGFAPLIGFTIGFASAGKAALIAALDPDDAIHRLARPAPAGGDLVRISGTLRSGDGFVCVVAHERQGNKGGWGEDFRALAATDPVVTAPGGETFAIDPSQLDVGPVVLGDPGPTPPGRVPMMPSGGRTRTACFDDGAPVFVEGCVTADEPRRIGSCGRRRALLVAGDGTPQTFVDQRAASLAGSASRLGAAALIVLLYGWIVLRARPLADALFRWSGVSAKPVSWRLLGALAGAPVALLVAGWIGRHLWPAAFVVDRADYVIPVAIASVAGGVAHFVQRRRRALIAAVEPVRAAATIGLRDARGDVVELAVRVAKDAPTVRGPLSGRPRAFAGLCITRVRKDGRNHTSFVARASFEPNEIPVEDASGTGWLDLVNAEADIRAVRQVVRSRAAQREPYRSLLGDLALTGDSFVIEERFIEPGEQLYVLGAVERIEPARNHTTYRVAEVAPVVGGTNDRRLIVHAGSERTLLRALALERRYLDLGLGVLGAVVVWVALTAGYFISR